jgi:hypothetical protein
MFGYSNHLRGSTQGKGTGLPVSCQLTVLTFPFRRIQHGIQGKNIRDFPVFSALTIHAPQKNHMPVLPQTQKELEEAYRKLDSSARR